MTTLYDVTRLYVDGVQQIKKFAQSTINDCHQYDSTFKQRRDSLSDYNVTFSGMGAVAFSGSVDLNLLRSQQLLYKLDTVRMASDEFGQMIQSNTADSDTELTQMLYLDNLISIGEYLQYYNTTPMEVQLRLRDGALAARAVNIDSLLAVNQDAIVFPLQSTEQEIFSEIQTLHNRNVSYFQDPKIDPADSLQYINNENDHFHMAQVEIKQIYTYVLNTLEDWRKRMQNLTASYITSLLAASQINAVSSGEIVQQLTQTKAPVVIWQAADGSLIVGVNDSNVSAQDIEKAIENYIQTNGVQQPAHVTIVGYKQGVDGAQQVAQDVSTNPSAYNFQVNNEVLVGGDGNNALGTPAKGTEYDAYQFTGDTSASGGWAPDFSVDPAGIASNFITGLSWSNVGGAALGYAISVGDNIDHQQTTQGQLEGTDPNHYYSVDQLSKEHIQLLQNEPGAHSTDFNSSSNYAQSTDLNNAALPDPLATSQKLPGGNVTRTPVTSSDTGQLSAPTYYSFGN